MSHIDHQFQQGFADAIWVSEWANAWERMLEDEEIDDTPWPPGSDVMDYAPQTHADATDVANDVLQQIEATTGRTIDDWYGQAAQEKYDAPDDEYDFGFQLGMSWLGHGVGSNASHEATEGMYGEVMVEVDPDSGDAELVYSSTWTPAPSKKKYRKKGPGFEFLN